MIIKKITDLTDEEKTTLINRNKMNLENIYPIVREILDNVKNNGDSALKEYTKKFDKVDIDDFKVHKEEIEKAYNRIDYKIIEAIEKAHDNIKSFHEIQFKNLKEWEINKNGIKAGQIIRPIEKAGCYVPGGRAFYPSTVLMTVVPAKVAGVEKVVVVSPPNGTEGNPATLVASDIAKADEIYKIGGAQAIGALAYGTETIPKVDIIVGPGNIFVTAAKMMVYGNNVAIDFPAGPSEVLIICDEKANNDYVAIDFLAQAEHDPNSSCIITTTSKEKAEAIKNKIMELINKNIKRKEIINSSLKNSAILYGNLDECINLSNEYAPEHLEIITENPREVLKYIKNAGSIFLGSYSPVPVGDYASGTNHVLPTSRCAKMYSGLSVDTFIKKPTVQELTKEGLESISDIVITLAEAEGLYNHAESVKKRLI
ncbi:histidinol dehydrogenase [Methanothermococcus okinawensis]|uniref:Histidinol dehydrogenase n=1 Tax=Methanothermococcus okinawensis (strain DSM 14208 / JCM 11175 / IH1) TaxID=647113 RepID=F8AJP8_METOI|nr:histidinol dehydrogenase [Methanothermococcus okinawensis]AEH07246.1 Histidinol dehydrogenase [Methanothermococcus okinawensis IH1]